VDLRHDHWIDPEQPPVAQRFETAGNKFQYGGPTNTRS
jgi:hypothetical protein